MPSSTASHIVFLQEAGKTGLRQHPRHPSSPHGKRGNNQMPPQRIPERLPRTHPNSKPLRPNHTDLLPPPNRPWLNSHHPVVESLCQIKAAPQGSKIFLLSVQQVSSGGHCPPPPATPGVLWHLRILPQSRLHGILLHPQNWPHWPSICRLRQNISNRPYIQQLPPPGAVQYWQAT